MSKSNKIWGIIYIIAFLVGLLAPRLFCATATVSWDANTESDLAGYKIYYGTMSGNYNNVIYVGNSTSYKITGLEDSTLYYFAVTALDFSDNESNFSNEVSWSSSGSSGIPPIIEDNITAYNYENPFIAEDGTIISFTTVDSGSVTIEIYTATGTFIRGLVENYKIQSGTTSILWNGRDDRGDYASVGVYMGVIFMSNYTTVIKMAVKL